MNDSVEARLSAEGPEYRADYEAALRELAFDAKPRLLLPAPPVKIPQLHPFSISSQPRVRDLDNLHDLVTRLSFQKTVNPFIRDCLLDGLSIGRVIRNPAGLGWTTDQSKRLLFWSMVDAGCWLVALMRQADHE